MTILLCLFVFVINSTDVRGKNLLVQKDRQQVCKVICLYLGLIGRTKYIDFNDYSFKPLFL